MKRHEIRERFNLGGPGSGNRGHTGGTGGPGNPGGSSAKSARNIGAEFQSCTTNKEVNMLKKEVEAVIDPVEDEVLRDKGAHPEKYPDYSAYRVAVVAMIPVGYPTSIGELDEMVQAAKDRIKSNIVSRRSAADARADRILTVTDSSGKKHARKWS